ncbi:MAG: hypothetical protein IH965_07935 [Gemmatimonadetes bacterium]|nr:hypothetical protein [Gemmatimonadota bacterium]
MTVMEGMQQRGMMGGAMMMEMMAHPVMQDAMRFVPRRVLDLSDSLGLSAEQVAGPAHRCPSAGADGQTHLFKEWCNVPTKFGHGAFMILSWLGIATGL